MTNCICTTVNILTAFVRCSWDHLSVHCSRPLVSSVEYPLCEIHPPPTANPLIRKEANDDDNKHWASFLCLFAFSAFIGNLASISPSTLPPHTPNIASSVKCDPPSMAEKWRRVKWEIWGRIERDPRGPGCLSFPLLGCAALPRFLASGKLHFFFPLERPI